MSKIEYWKNLNYEEREIVVVCEDDKDIIGVVDPSGCFCFDENGEREYISPTDLLTTNGEIIFMSWHEQRIADTIDAESLYMDDEDDKRGYKKVTIEGLASSWKAKAKNYYCNGNWRTDVFDEKFGWEEIHEIYMERVFTSHDGLNYHAIIGFDNEKNCICYEYYADAKWHNLEERGNINFEAEINSATVLYGDKYSLQNEIEE